jgi:hypothetical protein
LYKNPTGLYEEKHSIEINQSINQYNTMLSRTITCAFLALVQITSISAGTGIGQSIRTGNGSPDGVIRTDRTLNNEQKTDSGFNGIVPDALGKLGLQ